MTGYVWLTSGKAACLSGKEANILNIFDMFLASSLNCSLFCGQKYYMSC